jgi:hypothetical protein
VPGGLQPQGLERERARKRARMMVKMDTWDEMRCPMCDTWFYPEKNQRRWCQVCNDKEIEGESNE